MDSIILKFITKSGAFFQAVVSRVIAEQILTDWEEGRLAGKKLRGRMETPWGVWAVNVDDVAFIHTEPIPVQQRAAGLPQSLVNPHTMKPARGGTSSGFAG